jgi:hypothetical protein
MSKERVTNNSGESSSKEHKYNARSRRADDRKMNAVCKRSHKESGAVVVAEIREERTGVAI